MEVANVKDLKRLEELEVLIKRDLGSFYEVGSALTEIRERGLYKIKNGGFYRTFEAYAKGTWDMSKTNANRLITSSAVIDNLTPGGVILPSHEKHVRHLTKLSADQQVEAWDMALETAKDGKVTEALVYKIVKDMLPPKPPKVTVAPAPTPEAPRPGDAHHFANLAIAELRCIMKDDKLREAAYDRVREWMDKH
jgi:hypothetical protein